jgi:hypothetical protein
LTPSRQRDEARQKKLGKGLEWDQDKPTLDVDGKAFCNIRVNYVDALPADQRYYNNYTRRGRGFEGGSRGPRGRYGGTRGRGGANYSEGPDQQTAPATNDQDPWPALPSATSS